MRWQSRSPGRDTAGWQRASTPPARELLHSDGPKQGGASLPTGRESQGDGVPRVVGGRESRPQGEGGQVVGQPKRPGTRDATRRNDFGSRKGDHGRAVVRSKDSCPVRRGAVGKVPSGNSLAAYSTACTVLRGRGRHKALLLRDQSFVFNRDRSGAISIPSFYGRKRWDTNCPQGFAAQGEQEKPCDQNL
jgi:hypothetical protein